MFSSSALTPKRPKPPPTSLEEKRSLPTAGHREAIRLGQVKMGRAKRPPPPLPCRHPQEHEQLQPGRQSVLPLQEVQHLQSPASTNDLLSSRRIRRHSVRVMNRPNEHCRRHRRCRIEDDQTSDEDPGRRRQPPTATPPSPSTRTRRTACGRRGLPLWAAMLLVMFLILFSVEHAAAVPFGTCGSQLRSSDADANSELSQSEYVAFVRALSRNTVSTEFYQYPTSLASAFTSRKTSSSADAGAPVPAQDSTDQTLFCRDVYAGLSAALQLTTDNSTCTRSLTLGDYSRENLLTEDEYARFLSWLTSSAVSSSTAFGSLGDPLPAYFADFADTVGSDGTTPAVNVTGTKPGTSATVDAAQLDTMVDFCTASLVGVTLAAEGTDPVAVPTAPSSSTSGGPPTSAPAAPPPTTAATTSAPASSPTSGGGGGGSSFVPSFDFSTCLAAMAFSDLSRDAMLNQAEYVRFLNRLSSDEYVDPSTSDDLDFTALPSVLQDNYDNLAAGGGGINVEGGTERGVDPTAEEAVLLGAVCNATDQALQEARDGGGGGSTSAPAPAPVAAQPTASGPTTSAPVAATPTLTAAPVGTVSTPAPTAFMSKDNCIRYMMLSETSRDGYMDQTEYLRFVNLAANRVWSSLTFDELEPILKDNYDSLATENGTIPVVGYNPNVNATPEELDHLDVVCSRSSTAIQSALSGGGTWPPTSAPAPASTQTIYNGYLISNSVGLKAPGLQEGSATRQAIHDAYTVFVTSQVNLYTTGSSRRSLRSRRALLRSLQQSGVKLNPDSISTDSIVDSICPANSTGTSCQTVYGSFDVNVPSGADPAPVVQALTTQTQAAVSTDLQGFVEAGVAATPSAQPVTVEGPAPQNRPPVVSRAPTVSPADAPTAQPGGAKGSNPGKTAAAIIGFSLLIGLCVGGAIYLHRRGYKVSDAVAWVRDRMSNIPALAKLMESTKGSAKNKKATKSVGEKADQASRDGGSTHLEDDGGIDNNGFGTFETVSPGVGKPSFYKSEEERDGSSSVDFMEGGDDSESAGFSVEQSGTPAERASSQQAGKTGVFNAFGLGKKKSTAGLDDSYGSLQNPEAFQENAANDFADYGFDDPTADFANKNSDSMGELFGKTDDFAAGGAKESAWGAGDGNEWNGAWGAGNAGEAPRSKVDDEDDDDDDSGSDTEASGSLFERKTKGDRGPTVEAPENLVHLDSMVEQGNWDGVMAAQTKFDTGFELDEGSNPSRPSLEESEGLSESRSSADDFDDEAAPAGDESVNDSHYSLTSAEQTRREQFRQQVENLVRKVVPDEIDNVSAMMDQFAGREAELINTLQNMKERTTVQRARKAIHKSKGIPQRDNPAFATGGTDGSAAIAAASTLGVRAGDYGEEEGEYDDEDDDYDDEGDEGQSYDEEYDDGPRGDDDDEEAGSQYSGSQSYDDEGEEGGSQYSGSQSRSQDDNDGGSEYDDDDRSGSYSGSGSRSRSQDGGSYDDGEPSASYDDDGGDQEGSYDDEDGQGGSYDEEGQEGSYYSGEEDQEGSQHSGSGSGSGDDDQDHDASYTDDQGSYDEDQEGEGSYRSGDDDGDGGSRDNVHDDPDRSHSGSRSYDYDDEGADQEGSYYSEEGSGSDSRRREEDGDGSVDYGYE